MVSNPHTFTQTWAAGAVVFTGIQANITDAASASTSLLLDLQVGGASRFSVDKAGNVAAAGNLNVQQDVSVTGNTTLNGSATVTGQLIISNPAGGIDMGEFGNPP